MTGQILNQMAKYKHEAKQCRDRAENSDTIEAAEYFAGMARACERHGSDMLELADIIRLL